MNSIPKKVAVLGSTGSVGEQALDVARRFGMQVVALSANQNVERVEAQAREFGVRAAAMADPVAAEALRLKLADTDVCVYCGADGICQMISDTDADLAVNSIIGTAGLLPSLAVIDSCKDLALANL